MRYLVDTDRVIHYLNGRADIVTRIQELSTLGIAMSVISLAELYEGVYYSRNPRKSEQTIDDFLSGIDLLGIDEEITRFSVGSAAGFELSATLLATSIY